MTVAIVEYGAGNIGSVVRALERIGYASRVTHCVEVIKSSPKVIIPGVGNATHAMTRLSESGLTEVLSGLTQPVLGICLGMQLLAEWSEEGETECLGLIPVRVERLREAKKIPHTGWSKIHRVRGVLFQGIPDGAYLYFVHSYKMPLCEACTSTCAYGEEFASSVERLNYYGVQFHPEKSGKSGETILRNFMEL